MINDWQRVTPENLPPEDVMVETKIDDDKGERNVCLLCREGRLWYTGTGNNGMYVYYTPTHWRHDDRAKEER